MEEINEILDTAFLELDRDKTEFDTKWLLPDYTALRHYIDGFCAAGHKKIRDELIDALNKRFETKN